MENFSSYPQKAGLACLKYSTLLKKTFYAVLAPALALVHIDSLLKSSGKKKSYDKKQAWLPYKDSRSLLCNLQLSANRVDN